MNGKKSLFFVEDDLSFGAVLKSALLQMLCEHKNELLSREVALKKIFQGRSLRRDP